MLLSALLLLVSLVLHEIAHVHAAGRLGDPTPALLGRRTLNPLAHMDPVGTIVVPGLLMLAGLPVVGWMRPVPLHEQLLTPSGVAFVALMGPVANAGLAALALCAAGLAGWQWPLELARINLLLAGFNLLPVPGLDGWRVVRNIL